MTVYRRALAVALLALAALLPSVASALTYTSSNGRVVFSTGSGSTTPSAKPYTTSSSTFGAAIQLPAGAANQAGFVLKNAPLRDEYLAGYVTTAGMLYVLRYNGATSSWSSEWSVNVGGDGVNGRRFDIAYEKATGRGMVAYSANTANAAMHYRVWDPATATWGTEQSFGSDHISGVANVVKLASQPNTSRIAVGVVDASSYLTAFIWNGSAWGSEPGYSLSAYPLLSVSTPGDMESFDLAFGSLAGDLMVAWSAKGASPVLYTNRYQASGGWLASTYNMGSAGIGVAEVVVAADPQSDQMGLVFSSKKLWFGFPVTSLAGYIWTGSTWSSLLSFGTLTSAVVSGSPPPDVPRQRPFTAFWLWPNGSYSFLVIPQSDPNGTSGSISYSIASNFSQTGWSAGSGTASIAWPRANGTVKTWFQSVVDPGSGDTAAMVLFGDSAGSLWAKLVTPTGTPGSLNWSNADGGTALTNSLASTASQSFAFDFDHPVETVLGDNSGVEAPTGTPGCAAVSGSTTYYDVDHFTMATTSGTDTVQWVKVNVTSGNNAVGTIFITSDDGTFLGGTGYKASGSYYVYFSSPYIPVTSTATQYRVKVLPALYSALGSGNYTIAANVAQIQPTTNIAVGSDASNGSLVVDRIAPGDPVWGTNSTLPGQALLNWTNPVSDYANTVVLRSASLQAIATSALVQGQAYAGGQTGSTYNLGTDTVAYLGSGNGTTDNSGNGGGTYFYRAFAGDACNNYSPGATTASALVVPPVSNATTVTGLTASASSCKVTLTGSFTGDGNSNNSVSFTRKLGGVTTAFICATMTRNPPSGSTAGGNNGTWTCTDWLSTGGSQTYTYTATFTDGDGLGGSGTVSAAPLTAIGCPSSNGRVAYSTGSASTTPAGRPYTGSGTSNAFGTAAQLPPGAMNQTFFVLKASPTNSEYLAGYVTTAGVLYVLRYNGATSSWSSEWSATVGGDGVNGRRFDIAYEKLTGRGLVAYSSGGSNQSTAMRYRIWNPAGGRWGTEQSFGTLQLGGTANWVKLASRPGTNQLAVGVMDTTSLLSALIWDGSAWGNEPAYTLSPHPLPASLTAGDLDSFDLAFGSLSGDLMLVWPYNAPSGGGWSYQYYNQYQAATGSWFPSSANWNTGNGTSTMWQVVLAADPLSDQIGVVLYQHTDSSTTTNSLLQRIWTGSAWTPFSGGFDRFTNASGNSGLGIVATTSPNQRPFTAFWLNGAGTAQLVVPYSSATINGNQLVVNKTGYSVTAPALPKVWFQSVVDPSSPDRAMVSFSDSGGGSWAKRVVLGTPTAWLDDGSSAYQGSAPPLTNGAGLSPPTNLTLTSGSGSLAGGTYFYRITATNAAGETLPSTETSLTLASTGGVVLNWTPVVGATGYKFYRSTSAGNEIQKSSLSMATPVLTWTDADGGVALTSALASTTSQSFAFDYDHPPITVFGDYSTLEAVTGSPACAATATSSTVYDLDHFTLSTWPGTDNVTRVTVKVTTGNSAVGTLYVTSDDGATTYGSLGYQASGSYAIPVSIPVTTTVTQYRVQVKPALYSALPAGANYAIAANVVSLAATNAVGGFDPSSGSVLVDRIPPAAPSWGASSTAPGQVFLNWANPGTDYANTTILRSASGAALATSALLDGSGYAQGQSVGSDAVAYVGSGTSATDSSGAGTFYYRAFAADACNNYSAGATTAAPASPPAIVNPTTVVGLGASATSCTAVTLSASYTGDGNGSNSVSFTRDGNPFTCASLKRTVSGNSGAWTCADSAPSANATYSYGVTFADLDGLSGGNPVTASVSQAACPASGGTLSLGAHPSGASPGAIANPGQTNVLAGRFSLTANASGSGGSVSLNQILLANGGSATNADLGALSVYADLGSTVGSWDAADQPVATAAWSSAANGWVVSGFNAPLGTTSYLLTLSPAYGATPGRTIALSFSSASITADPTITVLGSQSITGGTVTIASTPVGQTPGDTATGSQKPMVLILNPASGTTLSIDNSPTSKGVRVQVQVYDPSHSAIGSVTLSHDGGKTFSDQLALNSTYDSVVNQKAPYYAHVYQADLTSIPAGSWTLQALAVTTGGGAGYSAPVTVSVNAKGSGDGNLLTRNDSNQLCVDCHAVQTHSSQSVSVASGLSRYGSWATSCRDCHAPHNTRNVQLVRESIVPPAYNSYQTAKPVRFWDRKTGDSGTANAISFVSSSAPGASGLLGPCQACHTRTGSGVARWRNSGNSDSHYTGASTQPCTTCHTHSNGFGGLESLGGQACGTCHSGTFWNMQAAGTPMLPVPRLTKHALGPGVQGTNDSFQNPNLTWTSPLSANAPASRSCVGMCHGDHVHNDPAAWPTASHATNFYANGTTHDARALTRDTNILDTATYGFATTASTGSVSASDYVSGSTQGCIACHTSPVDAGHAAVSGAAYDASAHNLSVTPAGFAWEYVLHDGSRFTRNCTKCHAGNQAEGQAVSYRGTVQGVHYSDNPSLLAGVVRPAGSGASNVCYNCHGNGVIGANNSNKNIASQIAKASGHPANADSVHDTVVEAAQTWGNALGFNNAASRHANCLDCHNPHVAQRTLTETRVFAGFTGQLAGPGLAGATGAKLSSTPAAWTAPGAGNFTAVTSMTPGADLEATLCFKCHSSFYWGSDAAKIPTSPSGGYPETDQAMEFNPNNASFHPILAPAPNPTPNILKPWKTTSRMRCTDCHASDTRTDPGGPHGSAASFILKGPNTDWSSKLTIENTNPASTKYAGYKVFCGNCHDVITWTNSGTESHSNNAHPRVECFSCHSAIPHGGPRPGLLVANGGVDPGLPAQSSYDTSAPYFRGTQAYSSTYGPPWYTLYIRSYPSSGAKWTGANCSCNVPDLGTSWHPTY